jgi:translation initiation factor eIF-2B subunit gamma
MKEFTVILYAGGSNRLSTDLSLPKCLLPIGNRPLIWYTLQIIQSHPSLASSPLLILISGQYRQILDDYLSTLNLTYEIVIHRQHHESTSDDQQQNHDELGTLNVLRSCYSRIRTESICLISSDLFGKVNLTSMINTFRVRDASLSMLLVKSTTTSNTGKDSLIQPGQKTRFTAGKHFLAMKTLKMDLLTMKRE